MGPRWRLKRHLSPAFSPNGKELLTGTESGALLVWDVAKSTCVTVCTNLGRKVDRVTWLGNDRLVWGGNVTYWADGGKPVDHDKPAGAVLARDPGKVLWQFRSFVRNDFVTLAGARDGRGEHWLWPRGREADTRRLSCAWRVA